MQALLSVKSKTKPSILLHKMFFNNISYAGIAQLGESQTKDMKVPCFDPGSRQNFKIVLYTSS